MFVPFSLLLLCFHTYGFKFFLFVKYKNYHVFNTYIQTLVEINEILYFSIPGYLFSIHTYLSCSCSWIIPFLSRITPGLAYNWHQIYSRSSIELMVGLLLVFQRVHYWFSLGLPSTQCNLDVRFTPGLTKSLQQIYSRSISDGPE